MSSCVDKEMKKRVSHQQTSLLLHNKFILVLGDSIQRAVYKDLVLLLQKEKFLDRSQLRTKGEISFEQDCLVEGGCLAGLNNGTGYREIRQFQSDHHLVRFYFVTRIYSNYMQSILDNIRKGLKPDCIIVNSCVWDISRYCNKWISEYRENLNRFFRELKEAVPQETLIIWNLTMPLGEKIKGGFLVPEVEHKASQLRYDVIEANFYSGTLADAYGMDVLDLHFQFRFSLEHRMRDGVHWDAVVHRKITSLLLQHAAEAWGVMLTSSQTAAEDTQFFRKQAAFDKHPELAVSKPKRKRKQTSSDDSPYQDYTSSWNNPKKRVFWTNVPQTYRWVSPLQPLHPPNVYYRHEHDTREFREDYPYWSPHHFEPQWEQRHHDGVMRTRHNRHHYEPYTHNRRHYSSYGYY
ncbi:PC-esterase domain-containing protein 1A isoform X2 [Gouania willdenowi]|uniref:PC-esterase domain-containing protein 1A isoform X2 n=1 Tax=Gouania willdenowi TaxID=441366 RepID=UPI001056D3D0|nr:PC-esterase domain-containing protein 1A-like isoform X2 [Gouania willdenowi]